MTAFGQNLKRIRETQGMTQTALAKELKKSVATVNLYEKGEREPPLLTIKRIAKVLSVTVNELFEGVDDESHDAEMAQFLKAYEKAKLRWEDCDFTIEVRDGGYIEIRPNIITYELWESPAYELELKKTDFVRLTEEMENHIKLSGKKEEEFRIMTRVIMSAQAARRRINPHNLVGQSPIKKPVG